jgi:glycine hydroxymethyltransferase
MGLEAIEEIEVIAAELAAEVFDASFVEFRVPSGAIANLMVFMATAKAGDAVITPPAAIAGHVTHHTPGAAGLYGLEIHEAPIDPDRYTVDVAALGELAERVQPKLITIGSSLNLHHHDVGDLRRVADAVGAVLMFDAAHLSGPIAGGAWPNPLDSGAHVMTMSTYKSLAGPTAGLVLTNDASIAERIDAIAFPGLTANFDVGKTAALAYTLNDWLVAGPAYASAMVDAAAALAEALTSENVAVFRPGGIATKSHAFALEAAALGGGMATAQKLRTAGLLTSAIGLPSGDDDGVRIGTNELVRWGATTDDMAELAELIAQGLSDTDTGLLAGRVGAFRSRFTEISYTA